MLRFNILLCLAAALIVSFSLPGCGKSSSSNTSSSTSSAGADGGAAPGALTGTNKDAADAVMAEIKNHWVSAPDGWVTARTTGSAYAPDHFLRELREITIADVQPNDVTDSDKLNGIDWAGSVTFKPSPCREAGDPGMALDGLSNPSVDRVRGQWCQWVDWQPDPVTIYRAKGQWQIDQDTWLLRGTAPAAQDFANAGVK
jgi:hypothetical protein